MKYKNDPLFQEMLYKGKVSPIIDINIASCHVQCLLGGDAQPLLFVGGSTKIPQFKRALREEQIQEIAGAVTRVESFLEEYPEDPPLIGLLCIALYNHGLLTQSQGKLDEAYTIFERITQINKRYIDAYLRMAFIHSEKGEVDKAIEMCQQGVYKNVDLSNLEPLQMLAHLKFENDDDEEAGDVYQKLKTKANDPCAMICIGNLFYKRVARSRHTLKELTFSSEMKSALRLYLKALSNNDSLPHAALGCLHILCELGYLQESSQMFSCLSPYLPPTAPTLITQGHLQTMCSLPQAASSYHMSSLLPCSLPFSQLYILNTHFLQKDFQKCLAIMTKLVEKNGDDPNLQYNMGIVCLNYVKELLKRTRCSGLNTIIEKGIHGFKVAKASEKLEEMQKLAEEVNKIAEEEEIERQKALAALQQQQAKREKERAEQQQKQDQERKQAEALHKEVMDLGEEQRRKQIIEVFGPIPDHLQEGGFELPAQKDTEIQQDLKPKKKKRLIKQADKEKQEDQTELKDDSSQQVQHKINKKQKVLEDTGDLEEKDTEHFIKDEDLNNQIIEKEDVKEEEINEEIPQQSSPPKEQSSKSDSDSEDEYLLNNIKLK